jgi:hypothetical protein
VLDSTGRTAADMIDEVVTLVEAARRRTRRPGPSGGGL